MNWTGGRLQRHSKSNANKVIRTQKEHFARTRVGRLKETTNLTYKGHAFVDLLKNDSLLIDDTPSNNTDDYISTTDAGDNKDDNNRRPPQICDAARVDIFNNSKSRHPSRLSIVHRDPTASIVRSSRPNKFTTAGRRTSLFEKARKDLLRQVDWPRVLASKPVGVDPRSQQSFQGIGRHRRIKSEHRLKTRPTNDTSASFSMHRRNEGLEEHEPRRAPSSIGGKESCMLTSSESRIMIPSPAMNQSKSRINSPTTSLKLREHQPSADAQGGPRALQRPLSSDKTNNTRRQRSGNKLLTLRDARDCASFDEVKAKSSQYSPEQSIERIAKNPPKSMTSTTSYFTDGEQSTPRLLTHKDGPHKTRANATRSKTYPNGERSEEEELSKLQVLAFPVRYEHQAIHTGSKSARPGTNSTQTRFTIDEQLEYSQLVSQSPRFLLPSDGSLDFEDNLGRPCITVGCNSPGTLIQLQDQGIATSIDNTIDHQDSKHSPEWIPDLHMANANDRELWSISAVPGMKSRILSSSVLSFLSRHTPEVALNRYVAIEEPVGEAHDSWLKRIFAEDFNKVQLDFRAPPTPAPYTKITRPETSSLSRGNSLRTQKSVADRISLFRPAKHINANIIPALHSSRVKHNEREDIWQDAGSPLEQLQQENQPHTLHLTGSPAYAMAEKHYRNELDAYQGPATPQLQQRGIQQGQTNGSLLTKRKAIGQSWTWNEQSGIQSFSSANRRPVLLSIEDADLTQQRKRPRTLCDPLQRTFDEIGNSIEFQSSPRQTLATSVVGNDRSMRQTNGLLSSYNSTLCATPIGSTSTPQISQQSSRVTGSRGESGNRTNSCTYVDKATLQLDLRSSSSVLSMDNVGISRGLTATLKTPGICRTKHIL